MNKKEKNKLIEEFNKQKDDLKTYLKADLKEIEKTFGVTDIESQLLALEFCLLDLQDTLSYIASTCGNLSYPTYKKEVYVNDIEEVQKNKYETMHYEDIIKFLEDSVTREDLIDFLDEYFCDRDI